MCHQNPGPRCSTCHKPAPRHRCRCPARYASDPTTVNTKHDDGLPTYAAATIAPPPPNAAAAPLPMAAPSHYGDRGMGYRACGYGRRRQCRGPIRLLVSLVGRKVREKKEREGMAAAGLRDDDDEREGGARGVVETGGEKLMEEKDGDVKVLTTDVGSLSL